ncbi:MAG: U32 family peptidase [Oscillibacter sp.]|nr:U32 family peptidase [Oscillibacter sp.]
MGTDKLPAGRPPERANARTFRERKGPELLAPAGDLERLRMAVLYGADAVYLAGTDFGMRAFAGNFSPEGLAEAVDFAHAHGVRVHCTVNTMPRNDEMDRLPAHLERLEEAGVDAIILADLGAFQLAGRYAPHAARHVSTQAGVTNYEAARAWHDLGASRVILARELSLEEIQTIRDKTPRSLELEAFVHGAMCVSYSGRCLLSNYMTGRDSSRGACAQPCRYKYALVEEKRPGEFFPIEEDGGGAYILNSRDMCMIDHLEDLQFLDSLKIEGRAKSAYYAAVVTAAYRHGLDATAAGEALDPVWRDEVEHVSHRPYSTGFFYGQPGQYYEDARYIREWQIAAVVTCCDGEGNATLSLRNKFRMGDEVELVGPGIRPFALTVPEMEAEDGLPLFEPRTPQSIFRMKLPRPVPPWTMVRRVKSLSAK